MKRLRETETGLFWQFWILALSFCAFAWLALATPAVAQQSAQNNTDTRCNTAAPTTIAINTATSGNVELVALSAGKKVYVCGFSLDNDTATTGLQFIHGTGTACATDEADFTGVYTVAALTFPNASSTIFATGTGEAFCIELSTNTQVNGQLTYVQY
jgi:hypothetical protein